MFIQFLSCLLYLRQLNIHIFPRTSLFNHSRISSFTPISCHQFHQFHMVILVYLTLVGLVVDLPSFIPVAVKSC